MLLTYKLLKHSWIVDTYDIIDLQQKTDWYYFKCKAVLKDNTELWIVETYETGNLSYSYHWQNSSGKLIKRWDNAPHHKKVTTYPHHIHSPKIEPSLNPDFQSILKELESDFKNRSY